MARRRIRFYRFLKKEKRGLLGPLGGGAIKWNFTKFLVDRKRKSWISRFASTTKPESLTKDIENLLESK